MINREAIFGALYTLLQTVPEIKTFGRRYKLAMEVPMESQPALYLVTHRNVYKQMSPKPEIVQLQATIIVYTCDGRDPNVVPVIALNNILDSIDAALQPTSVDFGVNQNTLGGLVAHCRIEGEVMVDPGDLDGQAVAQIPIRIVVP